MNKIYYDANKNIEIVDVSGIKTIEELEKTYNTKLLDVTTERETKAQTDRLKAEEEIKLKVEIRRTAINKLKALGLTEEEINAL